MNLKIKRTMRTTFVRMYKHKYLSEAQDEKGTKPSDECLPLSAESHRMQSSRNCTENTQNAAIITRIKAMTRFLNAKGRMGVVTSLQTLHQVVNHSAEVLVHPSGFIASTTRHLPSHIEQQTLFGQRSKVFTHFAARH